LGSEADRVEVAVADRHAQVLCRTIAGLTGPLVAEPKPDVAVGSAVAGRVLRPRPTAPFDIALAARSSADAVVDHAGLTRSAASSLSARLGVVATVALIPRSC